jgi:hypothetical protein
MASSQNDRLEDQVHKVAILLKEIHTWFVVNLRDRPTTPQRMPTNILDPVNEVPLAVVQFRLYAESPSGDKLICNHASVHPKWNEKKNGLGESSPAILNRLFQCQCPVLADGNPPHQASLDALECELTLPGF